MSTGWVILNEEEEVMLECSSSITDWPSSTHVELRAIFLASGKNKIRVWCKCNNYSIISSIIKLIDSKLLEIMLIKVKGHSEIKDNEEADKMAKNNTEKSICIKIKDVQQKDLTYDIYWDGIRIDRHIRKFMDNLCEATLDAV
ncbi:hypothetical protein RclHR1_12080003 [Rhizophagus clarus]|uniref:Uncharacterized protein n=1 Tax=Rhizophagus clarus TaxID=94130 RepID=A0A2Z6Q671_9GLOM|nr:hypothetical protein RclHR1_12080003 [Rhizophagus clarus]